MDDSKSIKHPVDSFQPIRLERVADKVAGQLTKAITEGLYKIGDKLPPERELSERMGVSRPSIREALQKLEMLGLIETTYGGGSVVKNLTEQAFKAPIEFVLDNDPLKLLELTEVRTLMEMWASRKAAENRTEPELNSMRNYLEAMESDFEKGMIRAELDFKFHAEIAAAAHNTIFLHLMHSIFELISSSVIMYREKIFLERQEQELILSHHRAVFKAIEASDPDGAETAMGKHLNFVIKEIKQRFINS